MFLITAGICGPALRNNVSSPSICRGNPREIIKLRIRSSATSGRGLGSADVVLTSVKIVRMKSDKQRVGRSSLTVAVAFFV